MSLNGFMRLFWKPTAEESWQQRRAISFRMWIGQPEAILRVRDMGRILHTGLVMALELMAMRDLRQGKEKLR